MVANGPKSKRPYAANLPKPPEAVTFFLDRTLGKRILASALRAAGLNVQVHDDHFPANAKDTEWLRFVGAKGWVVLTHDRRIRYRAIELTALMSSGVRVFAFTRGNLTGPEMATVFLKALPRVRKFLKKNEGPFIATLSRGGQVRMLVSRSANR